MHRKIAEALSLHEFIHRQRVFKLYRSFFRELRGILETNLKNDIRSQIKGEFRASLSVKDIAQRRNLIAAAEKQLNRLKAIGSDSTPSWLSVSSKDEFGETRGRVGEGWPWQR